MNDLISEYHNIYNREPTGFELELWCKDVFLWARSLWHWAWDKQMVPTAHVSGLTLNTEWGMLRVEASAVGSGHRIPTAKTSGLVSRVISHSRYDGPVSQCREKSLALELAGPHALLFVKVWAGRHIYTSTARISASLPWTGSWHWWVFGVARTLLLPLCCGGSEAYYGQKNHRCLLAWASVPWVEV